MTLNKPAFWDQTKFSLWAILLLPFTILYYFAICLKRNLTKKKHFNIKVVCVGNIYIGGTGKTPLTIKIASLLRKKINLIVIKKKYPYLKDEISLLKKNCNTIARQSRLMALDESVKNGYKLAILDDGFQDESIKKDISIVCFSSSQGIGNGYMLPSGPLREDLQRLRYADMVCINGDGNPTLEKTIKLHNNKVVIFYAKYKILNLNTYKNKKFFAFSGIGNNNNFINLLKKNNIKVLDYKFFPDHHSYTKLEIANLKKIASKRKLTLLTTEKDFFRIGGKEKKNIKYLATDLIIENEKKIIDIISKI